MATHRDKEYKHLNFKTSLTGPDLYVGARYVFFDSLRTQPLPQPIDFYSNIADIGSSLVNSAASQLKTIEEPDSITEGLSKIQQYINFIEEVAENEQKNEINFIRQMNDYLKKDETLQKNFNEFLKKIEEGTGFDYLQLMNLINEIMKEKDKLKEKREKVYDNNMNVTSKNFEILDESLRQQIIDLFEIGDFKELNKLINKHLLNPIKLDEKKTLEYTSPINGLIANKINSVMTNLGKNEAIRSLITQQITTSGWNKEELYNYIYAIVVEYITTLDYDNLISKSGAQLTDEIVNNFNLLLSKVNKQIADNAEGIFTKKNKKVEKTLEEVALTTKKALADIFDTIEQSDQQLILKQYLTTEEINKLKHFHQTLSSVKYRENFSKILGNAIRRRFNELGFSPTTTDKNKIKKEIEEFMEQNTASFIKYNFQNDFKAHFNIKTTGNAVAEYITTHLMPLGKAIVFGNKTKFKTDISVTFSFNPFKDMDFLSTNSSKQLDNIMDNFFSEFLEKYKEENLKNSNAAEQTDVMAAVEAYKNEMRELHDLIEKIAKKDELNEQEKQKLLDNFSNFLLDSISVKDYNYYTDQLGFHGGSLGGGDAPENVINNIYDMYYLGGISPVDKDLLLFSAINCGPDGFANGLKEDLANYLLGGAAIIMFDEGFTASTAFLEQIKSEFGFAVPALHLYKLQNKYIPASYIYFSIYKNLLKVYQLIASEVSIKNIQSQNKVIITNNITEEKDKPYWENMKSPQDRWNTVASTALSEVQITFIFMAGLLDIFEQIPKAFDNV